MSYFTVTAATDIRDLTGNTPLHLAAENDQAEAVSLLLCAGADGHAKNDKDNAPLHVAVKSKSTKALIVRYGETVIELSLLKLLYKSLLANKNCNSPPSMYANKNKRMDIDSGDSELIENLTSRRTDY